MNERKLEVFLEVYRAGNMTRAAEKLMISPQSVSRTVVELEHALQQKLFIRGRGQLTPTDAAARLKGHAERILEEYRAIWRQGVGGVERTQLKVYCTYGVVELLGPDFVRAFGEEHGDLLLYLVESPDRMILRQLQNGEGELAILSDPCDRSHFVEKPLFSTRYCYILPKEHPLAQRPAIRIQDLGGVKLVTKGNEFQLCINQMSGFAREGVSPEVVLETTSYYMSFQMARAGLGVGFVPVGLAALFQSEETVTVPDGEPGNEKAFRLVRPRFAQLTRAGRAFERSALQWAAEHRAR